MKTLLTKFLEFLTRMKNAVNPPYKKYPKLASDRPTTIYWDAYNAVTALLFPYDKVTAYRKLTCYCSGYNYVKYQAELNEEWYDMITDTNLSYNTPAIIAIKLLPEGLFYCSDGNQVARLLRDPKVIEKLANWKTYINRSDVVDKVIEVESNTSDKDKETNGEIVSTLPEDGGIVVVNEV